MQIQLNTDSTVEGREALAHRVEAEVERILGRFRSQITRVEVHLTDVNADKTVGADKRCLMEARPAGRQPVAVTHQAPTLEEAYVGATRKLRAVLDATFGRLNARKGADSIRDMPPGEP
ncbi:HPF/RaiA family ribosome-associated protein [Elioraea sp.]|jgi:hypothetical protein|uniref:HPF/RaiA family ribosome-associated protein n=1 Tax=Elioraea sp. TaxID=2185103 RepID=UPI003F717CEE